MFEVLRSFCARKCFKKYQRLQFYDSYVPIFDETPSIVTKCRVLGLHIGARHSNIKVNMPSSTMEYYTTFVGISNDESRDIHGIFNAIFDEESESVPAFFYITNSFELICISERISCFSALPCTALVFFICLKRTQSMRVCAITYSLILSMFGNRACSLLLKS